MGDRGDSPLHKKTENSCHQRHPTNWLQQRTQQKTVTDDTFIYSFFMTYRTKIDKRLIIRGRHPKWRLCLTILPNSMLLVFQTESPRQCTSPPRSKHLLIIGIVLTTVDNRCVLVTLAGSSLGSLRNKFSLYRPL